MLPIATLVPLGLVVFIARRPRRALIGAGLGFAASMLVLGAALLIARSVALNGVPAGVLPADAAAAAFDILVRFIKTALRTLLVAGLVVAVGAFSPARPRRRYEPATRCRLASAGSATAANPDRPAGGPIRTGTRYASGRSRLPRWPSSYGASPPPWSWC